MLKRRRHRLLTEEVFKAFQGTFEPEAQLYRTSRILAREADADLFLFRIQAGDPNTFLLQGLAGDKSLWPEGAPVEELLNRAMSLGTRLTWQCDKDSDSPFAGSHLSSAMVYPVTWHQRPVALIVAGFRSKDTVPQQFIRTMDALVPTLAALVRGVITRLYQTRKNEVAGELLRISEWLSASPDIDTCLSRITRAACDLTDSGGAILRTAVGGSLKVKSFFASDLSSCDSIDTPNDLASAEKAYLTGRSIIAKTQDLDHFFGTGPVARSLMCIPFADNKGLSGVLTLFDRKRENVPVHFGRLEREIVRALIRVGLMASYHIRKEYEVTKMSRSLEAKVRELTLLHKISRAVLDRKEVTGVLRFLLEAVTNVEGFGFDRAFLFLLDEEKMILLGHIGVEAFPLEDAKETAARVRHTQLDKLIEGYAIEVRTDGGVVPRTVLEKRSFKVRLPGDRNLVNEEIVRYLGGVHAFATVPLVAEDRVLGVIWVDNLRTGRPIGHEDFQLLVSAAAQAGLAVERSFQAEALDVLNSKLIDLQNRMIQWEKMAALGEMAATVAHDIRNPLVSIGGFTRRLRKSLADDDRGVRYADIIIQEVDRLERTLDNVMSYSRSYGHMDRKPVALYGLLSECAELFKENFKKKKIYLQRRFDKNLPEIVLDERQIKQAVLNVLFNAGEAVGENSEVIFEARVDDDQGMLVISITDSGGGIEEKDMNAIFTPFYTTKSAGTGLGLTIAHRAVTGHGGEIRVDNRCGEGVTFSINLPIINPVDQTLNDERTEHGT
jgi:signal transduction histidine kinase